MSKRMKVIWRELTPWKPALVFYNSGTADLYKPNSAYEALTSRVGYESCEYCTELCDIMPALKPQRALVSQLKGMMQSSLNNYKSELDG